MTQTSANVFALVRSRTSDFKLYLLLSVSLVLWYRPLVSTLKLALASDAHTHILLIVPLTLALIFVRIRETVEIAPLGRWPGTVLLCVALLVRGCLFWGIVQASPSNALSLDMLALVIWWIGSVVVCYGMGMLRAVLFPLCLLFLVVPMPDRVVDWLTQFLQYQSAVATEWLFRAVRVPVTRDGVFLTIPGMEIEVARECSSIRSSMMLIVITWVLANLFLRVGWRQVLLDAIAIPLSVAKNAVRIFTIIELGTRVDPGYLNGRLHHHGGFVFLGLALMVVIGLLWRLRRGEAGGSRKMRNAELRSDRTHGFSVSGESSSRKLR